jgi:hypothetical protein
MRSLCTAARFVDTVFGLPTGEAVCRQKVVNLLFFVDNFVDKQ